MDEGITNLVPVILSGGTGTRLWPLSRRAFPKQLLPLIGANTLLQEAALRGASLGGGEIMVIANEEHRFAVAEQLQRVGIQKPVIVLEPEGKNTGPAIAVAALLAAQRNQKAILLVMPSDHSIPVAGAFRDAVIAAAPSAADGALVLFGVRPTGPETGFGYIRIGDPVEGSNGVRKVAAFTEKPDRATAESYLAGGDYLWNAGIFLFSAVAILAALEQYEPGIVAAARGALDGSRADLDFIRLAEGPFGSAPSIAIDRAVLERTDRAAVLPVAFPWSDAGTWGALWEIADKDARGNVAIGPVSALDTTNSYLRSEGPALATLGLDNVVVVSTPDAVLVAAMDAVQGVSQVVAMLTEKGAAAATRSPKVHRPWGFYQSLHDGDRFQVKRITVNPGARLSLQKHRFRAEHWVVVNGLALVTRDAEQITLHENESIFLPLGCVHRLENPGQIPLNLIEVQSGSYLGEDDIIRLEDDYARSPSTMGAASLQAIPTAIVQAPLQPVRSPGVQPADTSGSPVLDPV